MRSPNWLGEQELRASRAMSAPTMLPNHSTHLHFRKKLEHSENHAKGKNLTHRNCGCSKPKAPLTPGLPMAPKVAPKQPHMWYYLRLRFGMLLWLSCLSWLSSPGGVGGRKNPASRADRTPSPSEPQNANLRPWFLQQSTARFLSEFEKKNAGGSKTYVLLASPSLERGLPSYYSFPPFFLLQAETPFFIKKGPLL